MGDRPLPDWASDIDAQSWGQVFLKYVASHPAATIPIPGTSKPHHAADNMGALTAACRIRICALRWSDSWMRFCESSCLAHSRELLMAKMILTLLLVLTSAFVVADSHEGDQALQTAQAVQDMISELGLKESKVPARELPGWSRPGKSRCLGRPARAPGGITGSSAGC